MWPPDSPDPNPIKHLWDVLIQGGPASQTTELKGFPPRWCQMQQDTLRGSHVQARLEPNLMHSKASMFRTCSCMCHECLNLLRSRELGCHGDSLSSLLRFSGYARALFEVCIVLLRGPLRVKHHPYECQDLR